MDTEPEPPRKQIPAELLYYTVEDVAEMLQMSVSGVYELVRKENWPRSKYGSRIRFEHSDLEAIRAMHRVDTSPPEPRAKNTRIGTERQRARNRAYNIRHGLKEPPAPH